jgi:hypothetical protein
LSLDVGRRRRRRRRRRLWVVFLKSSDPRVVVW